jgi:hypothetical protein
MLVAMCELEHVRSVKMLNYSSVQGSALLHTFTMRRVEPVMLATLMLSVVQNTNAVTLNVTSDGLSLPGMFFAKLETLHAKHMSGGIGKVRLQTL